MSQSGKIAGGGEHAARVSPKTRTALLIGFAALTLFGVAEIASRFIEEPPRHPAALGAEQSIAAAFRPDGDVTAPSVEQDRELLAQYALALDRALASRDPQQRETAFNMLLPELLQAEPAAAVDLFARQPRGEARDALRDEMARRWATLDRENALLWVESIADPDDRQAAATTAVRALAAKSPEAALAAAGRLGVGQNDGTVEHIVQIWVAEDPEAAKRWLAARP